jgi:peptidoglycan/LPS O-acetylase OafA/YrhL
MWELLAGTLVALLEIRSGRAETTAMRSVIPLAGAAAVVLSFWMFDEATIHPGFGSVPLILGVALVIRYAGRHEPVGAILGCRPLVGIGLISYSLYLWHFPVFAFARMRDPAAGDPDKLW